MLEVVPSTTDLVTMTPTASSKVRELLEAEGNPELALRVYVAGGGCSGLQYGMALDDSVMEDDTLVERDGIRVVVDSGLARRPRYDRAAGMTRLVTERASQAAA